jgi:hypothetical protein
MNSLYELDECCYQQVVLCFRFCLLLETNCRLCFLSNSIGWTNVSKSVATVGLSSDRQMMSAHPSLQWATLAIGIFGLLLWSYHCSDALVAMGRMPMTTVTYNPLLECMFVVVLVFLQTCTTRSRGGEKPTPCRFSTRSYMTFIWFFVGWYGSLLVPVIVDHKI